MKHRVEFAREAIFEVVEYQLKDNTPPITNITYQRLTATMAIVVKKPCK